MAGEIGEILAKAEWATTKSDKTGSLSRRCFRNTLPSKTVFDDSARLTDSPF